MAFISWVCLWIVGVAELAVFVCLCRVNNRKSQTKLNQHPHTVQTFKHMGMNTRALFIMLFRWLKYAFWFRKQVNMDSMWIGFEQIAFFRIRTPVTRRIWSSSIFGHIISCIYSSKYLVKYLTVLKDKVSNKLNLVNSAFNPEMAGRQRSNQNSLCLHQQSTQMTHPLDSIGTIDDNF